MCLTEKVPIAKAEPKNLLTTIRNYMEVSSPHEIHTEMFISLLRVLLNRAPTSTQLHPPPPSSFQSPPSSLQHPQQYLNQNIARNWTISPNFD